MKSAWLLALSLAGCASNAGGGSTSSASTVPDPGNGMDDVKLACEARVAWKNTSAEPCIDCLGVITTQHCSCTPLSGSCYMQVQAVSADCAATTRACVASCAAGDCDCAVQCYAASAGCQAAGNALEGCTVAACGAVCR